MGIDALTHSGTGAPTWELVPIENQGRFKDFFAPHQKPEFDHTLFGPWRELVDLEGPEVAALISSLVQNRVEVNPTLVIVEVMFWGDDFDLLEEYEPDYAPTSLAEKCPSSVMRARTTNPVIPVTKMALITEPPFGLFHVRR